MARVQVRVDDDRPGLRPGAVRPGLGSPGAAVLPSPAERAR